MPSRLLTVYLFAVILASGIWIGTPNSFPFVWLAVLAVAGVTTFVRLDLPAASIERPRISWRDVALAVLVSLPSLIYLVATWRQEFPYLGDQGEHNACAIEAYAFWWPLAWIAAALAIAASLRWPRVALAGIVALAIGGTWFDLTPSFAGRYPGTLHFVSAPLRALMQPASPLNVERLLNVLAIPAWLLVLRPLVVRRRVDAQALVIAALVFWQKDDVYYMTSGYLEPWGIVLLLTAAEHLVRFRGEEVWRPLLVVGAAAMIKEQYILALPIIAVAYFPFRGTRREQLSHCAAVATAAMPFLLFWRARGALKSWSGVAPDPTSLTFGHFALFRERIVTQFGVALPLVILGLVVLVAFAARSRAFLVLMAIAVVDFCLFYFAAVQQPWAGLPRLNFVPLAMAAIALAYLPRGHVLLVASAIVLNGVGLVPALRDTFRPSSARSFVEHFDAPIYYPIRETLAGLPRGAPVEILTNGSHLFPFFLHVGPIEDQYPDLAGRLRMRTRSFTGATDRCRCDDSGEIRFAAFIRFANLGAHIPQRQAVEAEAAQCAAELRRTCGRTREIRNEDVLVGLVGWRR